MHTQNYHLKRFQPQQQWYKYTQTGKEIPSRASNLIEDNYVALLPTQGMITENKWHDKWTITQ